ncbi:MAG: HAD family hydrolase [Candidatus Methylomirabilales bacterium]
MNEGRTGFHGGICDVDGVLVASPHERAWRETLDRLFETEWRGILPQTTYQPERFTTAVYQEHVAGKPRFSGAEAALIYFGVPDAAERSQRYGECKQAYLIELITAGQFRPFPDGLRFVLAVKEMGVRVAAASSSKNAHLFLERIPLDVFSQSEGKRYRVVFPGMTLLELFDANVCGRFERGKPHPEIFVNAANDLGLSPGVCFVVEDATSGIQAARAGGMAALGVARLDDEALLSEAGADLVVSSLDDVALEPLTRGRLERRPKT